MCSTDISAARFSWRRIASARSILAAIGDVLVRNLYIHATAGRLSHHIETLASRRVAGSTMCSRTSHCNSIPVNSRSDIVNRPDLFEEEHSWSRISCGHSKNHTIGMRGLVPPNQTPPTPHLEASTNPWYAGGCSMSSATCVGRRPTRRMSADQSRSMFRRSSVTKNLRFGCLAADDMYQFNCPRIGLPHGIAMVANWRRPWSF